MKKTSILGLVLLATLSFQSLAVKMPQASENEDPLSAFKSFDFATKEVLYDESLPVSLYKDGPQVTIPVTYKNPKVQFRTAWVSTVANIDISNVTKDPDLTAEEEFKTQVNVILDNFEDLNLNAVTFQVSPMLDAWYPSDIAPWSQYLHQGGSDYTYQGVDPGFNGFDPLEWIISETHLRGMEFHAWFNPYRVTNTVDVRPVEEKLSDLAENNFARLNPELVYEFQNKLFLDPGKPEVVDFVIDRVEEVATKYDVDAIHLDDYFYPYKYADNGQDITFFSQDIDKQTFLDYNRGFGEYTKENAAKWREDNINILIRSIKESMDAINKQEKSSIQFGVSPFGIWAHAEENINGSHTPTGSTSSLRDQYADTRKWVKEGWVDYLTPQIYWAFNTAAAPYGELADWWNEQFEGVENSHLYVGHPNYKHVGASWDNNFKNPYEIPNQMRFNQKYDNIKGSAFFSYQQMLPKTVVTSGDKFDVLNNANEILKESYLNLPAQLPAKPWLDKERTEKVTEPTYVSVDGAINLSWTDTSNDSKFYTIYRQEGNLKKVDIKNPANLIARFGVKAGSHYVDIDIEEGKIYTYAVTIVDNAAVESKATVFNKNELEINVAALAVIEAIDRLPDAKIITLLDETEVIATRELVTALNDDNSVTNLKKLEAIEKNIAKLIRKN